MASIREMKKVLIVLQQKRTIRNGWTSPNLCKINNYTLTAFPNNPLLSLKLLKPLKVSRTAYFDKQLLLRKLKGDKVLWLTEGKKKFRIYFNNLAQGSANLNENICEVAIWN